MLELLSELVPYTDVQTKIGSTIEGINIEIKGDEKFPSTPLVVIGAPQDSGTQATAVAYLKPDGQLSHIEMVNKGSGYRGVELPKVHLTVDGNVVNYGYALRARLGRQRMPRGIKLYHATLTEAKITFVSADGTTVTDYPVKMNTEEHIVMSAPPSAIKKFDGTDIAGATTVFYLF